MNEILVERINDNNNNAPELTTLIEKKLFECEGSNKLTLKKIEVILNKIL